MGKMNKEDVIKIINNYKNPYPKDIFLWNNNEKTDFTRRVFNEFCYNIVENMRDEIKKSISEA